MHAIALAVFLLQQEQTHFVNEAGKDCCIRLRTDAPQKWRILIVLVMFLSLEEQLFYIILLYAIVLRYFF